MAANPSITTINISLPEAMRTFVEAQVAKGTYSSVSEYFRELLRKEQRENARNDLEAKLLHALQSPSKEMTAADWKRLRAELVKRHGSRGS
jgi:antitoxin ParD1/3/4